MESAPPPSKKLLTRVNPIDDTLLTGKSVIQGGPVRDGFWPELNKVFLIFLASQEPS